MPEPSPSRPASDRNLLFGILALQMDFISQDALIAAMHAWVLDKARPLGEILQVQGALGEDERAALDILVKIHLRRHGGDPERSLAFVSPAAIFGSMLDELHRVADPDLDASLARVGAAPAASGPAGAAGSTVDDTSDEVPLCSPVRYRVLRPHARGGLGEVFVAEDRELHREVAFKEIQKPYAHDPASRSRFLLEAEVNGRLEHPGVVPVYGLGSYRDGRPFYAMRFVRGESLKEAIARFHAADVPGRDEGERGLALRGLLGQFVAVCNAVAYAHSRGVLHRDLKPSNVMLGKFGETLVVDWGLAKVTGRQDDGTAGDEATLRPSPGIGSKTVAGAVVGTPAFMSPEQAAGRLDLLGPASDIYSLGATLYTLLSGQPPFRGDDPGELLRRVGRGEWVPPGQVKKGIPAALDAVCRKAMALDPRDRYATAQALAADVEHWLADEPVTAYREPWAGRARRWTRKHRPMVAGLTAASVVALVALGVGLWLYQQEVTARAVAEAKRQLEQTARKERLSQSVTVALDEAEKTHRQLYAQLSDQRRVQQLLSEIDQWQGLVDRMTAWTQQARKLAASDPDLLPAGLRDRLTASEQTLRQAVQDLALARELDGIRLEASTLQQASWDPARAPSPRYEKAFARISLAATKEGTAAAARKICQSPLRWVLLEFVDHWSMVDSRPMMRGLLFQVSQGVYPEGLRFRLPAVQPRDYPQFVGKVDFERESSTVLILFAHMLNKSAGEDEAKRFLQSALLRRPREFWFYFALGNLASHAWERVAYRQAAVAIRPNSDGARANLGFALWHLKDTRGAIEQCRQALRLNPRSAAAHNNLGYFLSGEDLESAIKHYKSALEIEPSYRQGHANLGVAFQEQGRFAAALHHLREAARLGSRLPNRIADCERFLKVEQKLHAILRHKARADTPQEMLDLAELCRRYKRAYAAAARFYADTFNAQPELAANLAERHRYTGACCAALAGSGKGEDADKLDSKERARLRGQALAWLRADLDAWSERISKGTTEERAAAVKSLRHWQADPDFAGVRGPDALGKLPEAERAEWQRLWDDVQALLEKAGGKGNGGK